MAPEDNRPHPSFLRGNMGTGRATRGGHLASDSLPVRVGGDQGINTSGSQEEPPVIASLCVQPPPMVNSMAARWGIKAGEGVGGYGDGIIRCPPFISWES